MNANLIISILAIAVASRFCLVEASAQNRPAATTSNASIGALSELLAASIHGDVDVDISAPNGTYTLQLLLYEGWRSRSADIVIEGKTVREKYDLLKEQGGTFDHGSLIRHTFTLTDGNIDIEFKDRIPGIIHLGGLILSKGIGKSTTSTAILKSKADLDLKDAIKAINFGDTKDLNIGDVRFAAAAVNATVNDVTNKAKGDVHAGQFQQKIPMRPPGSSAEQFVVADGLAVELFANEQQFFNPSSIDVDDKGRVWICETVNYRKNTRKEGDRIVILADTNGDGKVDKQTIFYQGHDIDGGHGVCVLGNKVIVSVPDKILILTDTDGDDRADTKTLLFQGKVLNPVQGQHDHAIHAVMFGPDGRLYFNFGNLNAHLRDGDGKPILDIEGRVVDNSRKPYQQGMVIRCELDGSHVEVLGHNFRNNWEVTVDSFGSMWQSDNDNGSSSCRVNFVMEHGNYGYNDEITGAGYQSHRTNIESTMQRQMWHQNDPGVVPNLLITGAGAPTGILVYEGDLLPRRFHGQMLLAEPARNVLWTIPVRKSGAGYTASKADALTTPGSHIFRPSDVSVAPDGSLIVADWFDPVVCCHATRDDRGRLFRIAPPGHKYAVKKFNYSTPEGAVAALRNPNLSVRYKAWTALNQMQERARAVLESLATDADPRMRARALWLLAAIKGNVAATIQLAITDKTDDVRAMALRIARRHRFDPVTVVRQLVRDQSALVRRECALSLRQASDTEAQQLAGAQQLPGAPKLWAELANQHDGRDRWYLEALGIGEQGHEAACFDAWLEKVGDNWNTPIGRDIIWRSRATEAATWLARVILDPRTPATEHPRFVRAFDFHSGGTKQAALVSILTVKPNRKTTSAWLEALRRVSPETASKVPGLNRNLTDALQFTSKNATFVESVRRHGLRVFADDLVAIAATDPITQLRVQAVNTLIDFKEQERIKAAGQSEKQMAILDALGFAGHSNAIMLLSHILVDDKSLQPTRARALTALAMNAAGEQVILNAIKQKNISSTLATSAARLLLISSNSKTRAFAASHLGVPDPGTQKSSQSLAKLVRAKPNIKNGAAVFEKAGCIKCHKVGDRGVEFGPDLSAIGGTVAKREMFVSILAPNASIKFGYEGLAVTLDDGDVLTGYRTSENETTLSLRMAGGIQRDIEKADIEKTSSQTLSLMPVGLETAITTQELVDLVGWLTQQKNAQPKTAPKSP